MSASAWDAVEAFLAFLEQPAPLPVTPVLQGLALTAQWLAVDPVANGLGVVVSDALDVELQM